MRIGIDVRYLSHGLFGGVHRYVTEIGKTLPVVGTEHEFILYADTKKPFELPDLPANAQVRYLSYRNPVSSFANDLLMRRVMERDHLDIAHFPTNYGFGPSNARTVVTLHDELTLLPLSHVLRSKGTPRTPRVIAMVIYLHLCSVAAIKRADMLLTISGYSKRKILEHCAMPADRIIPIWLAGGEDLGVITDQARLAGVRSRHQLPERFVLADALKNPATLIRAWRRLPADVRNGRKIVFFSRRPDPLPIVREAVNEGIAQLIIRAERPDLVAFFNMAEVFAFPSWIEGFGIPLVEAMACGAPVVASDRGSIPEIAGDAALIADAEDDATFATYLGQLFANPSQAAAMRERGLVRAKQFSWEITARQTLAAYGQLLTLNRRTAASNEHMATAR
ncbi:MAG: glycosyltransferase family 1 protein [Roseiflexaceae bacterium]